MVRRKMNGWVIARKAVFGAFLVSAVAPAAVMAQTSSYTAATDDVVINWNAMHGGGTAAPVTGYSTPYVGTRSTGGLLMPGPTTPRSRLYVAPQSGQSTIQLRKPGTMPTRKAPVQSASRAPAPAQVASAPPAAPKPPAPKPAAPAPVQQAAPEPPKPAPAPTQTASAPPAPAAPAAAPAPEAPAPPAPTASAPAAPPPAPAAPPAPAVADAPSAASAPAPTEQASAPTSAPTDGPSQVLFNADNTKLSADGQAVLDGVIAELQADDKSRVQLMAYAAGEDLSSSKARRISLSRALSVRSYLIEKGVRSTRIDVRALGDKAEGDQKNRVDVNMIAQ